MLSRIIWNTKTRKFVLWIFRFFPIRKGQVLAISWNGERYNCNPKSIIEEACSQGFGTKDKRLVFYFAFREPNNFEKELPKGVTAIEIGSLYYYYILFTSQFLLSNTRFSGAMFPYKKKGLTYIFTGHGGCGIKKIEFDAPSLSKKYLEMAAEDTQRIDLMLSGAEFRTRAIRSGYRYEGEILEYGMPRNDIFYDIEKIKLIRQKVFHYLNDQKEQKLPLDVKLLLYAPTFRKNGRRDVYGFDVDSIVGAFEQRFGGTWFILVSSHQNMKSYYKSIYDFSHPRVIDVGLYPELQDLLLFCDSMITDYSSAEMDFLLTKRPVFQLCRDRRDYDRGFYINPEELPFPYAETDDQLVQNILDFDEVQYQKSLSLFNEKIIGLKEIGRASKAVVQWMIDRI